MSDLPRNLTNWTLVNLFQTYYQTKRKELKDYIFIEICIRANDQE
jgi:hypothetical protein